jgi:hypothetical protein
MTKEEIMTRCRKVAFKIEGNKIFGDSSSPYDFVPAFRTKQLAENKINSANPIDVVHSIEPVTVCEFYLVPASRIDGTKVQ